jgi:hypothetical protein
VCGIAGYNCSKKWATKHLTEDKQKNILEEAWLHNLHRGYDAAGYFSFTPSGVFSSFKEEGEADNIFDNKIDSVPVSTVFAAHTRAWSVGSPKIMENNHPVDYKGIYVTHNGTIKNDTEIAFTIPHADRQYLPQVDSVAIPILLSSVDDPRDINEIGLVLAHLSGSFAFHAVWEDQPGLSLIARGHTSPLIVGVHADGCVVYGSEVESVHSMIDKMELNLSYEGWKFASLDGNKLILVENGKPIAWGSIPYNVTTTKVTRSNFIVKRLHPESGEEIYSSDFLADFAVNSEDSGRELYYEQPKNAKILYSKEHGYDVKTDVPPNSTKSLFGIAGEADYVIKFDSYYHLIYDKIEIVVDGYRKIVDIFNHDLTGNRWLIADKEPTTIQIVQSITDTGFTFKEFFEKKTTSLTYFPKKGEILEYQYVIDALDAAKKKANAPLLPMVTNSGGVNGDTVGDVKVYLGPSHNLDWANVMDHIVYHENYEMFFMLDTICKEHSELFSRHSHPTECETLAWSAAYAISCLDTIDVTAGLVPDLALRTDATVNVCLENKHQWLTKTIRQVNVPNNRYFEIDVAEECWDCGSVRSLYKIPDWLENIMGPRREVSIYAS